MTLVSDANKAISTQSIESLGNELAVDSALTFCRGSLVWRTDLEMEGRDLSHSLKERAGRGCGRQSPRTQWQAII